MRVVVADDSLLTRQGIVHLLDESGIEVVGQAEDAASLLRAVRLTQPDAAVVDIKMPPTHSDEGLVAAHRIRTEDPAVAVLVLSQYIAPSYAMRLIQEYRSESATSSRSESSTPLSWRMRYAGSPTVRQSSTQPSWLGSCVDRDPPGRSTGSLSVSARCSA